MQRGLVHQGHSCLDGLYTAKVQLYKKQLYSKAPYKGKVQLFKRTPYSKATAVQRDSKQQGHSCAKGAFTARPQLFKGAL